MADHLTLEQLSALLDEEADEAAVAHLGECERCAGVRDRLAETRAILREDLTLPDSVIDVAVSRGVAELGSTNVVALAGRRRNPLPWIAGVAAALVGVLGLAALVNGGNDRQTAETFATGGDAGDQSTASQEFGAGGGSSAAVAEDSASTGAQALDGDESRAGARKAFSSEDEVIAYLQTSGEAMTTSATACGDEATVMLGAPLEQLRSEDVAWQDAPASLWVDPPQRRAVLMRPGGCSLLADLRY